MATRLSEGYIALTLRAQAFNTKLATVEAKLKALQIRMQSVAATAKRMLMVGAVIVGGSVAAFAKFEKQMAFVSTMLDKVSMKMLPKFEKAIKSMAIEFGEGTKTITRGLYDILSASVAPEKALYVLRVAMKAAIGGMTDTAVSADVITTVLNSYGLAAKYAGAVSDILFAIVKKGKTTYAELAPAMGMVASLASSAGLRFQELAAGFMVMTRAGMNARRTSTAIAAIIAGFLKPTEEGAKLFKEKFGLALNTATLQAEGLVNVIRKLATVNIDMVAKMFPNMRGLRGLAAALKRVAEMTGDLSLAEHAHGLAQEAYLKMQDTLSFKMGRLWQSIKITAVELGEKFKPSMKKTADVIMTATEYIRDFIEVNGEAIVTVVKWTAAVLGFTIILPKLIGGLRAVIMSMRLLGVMSLKTAGKMVVSILPALLIIGAIAAAVYALRAAWINNFGGMKDMFVAWGNKIKEGWEWLVNTVIKPTYEWIGNKWAEIWPEAKKHFKNFVNDVIATTMGLWEAIKVPANLHLAETMKKELDEITKMLSKDIISEEGQLWEIKPNLSIEEKESIQKRIAALNEELKTALSESTKKGMQDKVAELQKILSGVSDPLTHQQIQDKINSYNKQLKTALSESTKKGMQDKVAELQKILSGVSDPLTHQQIQDKINSYNKQLKGFLPGSTKEEIQQKLIELRKQLLNPVNPEMIMSLRDKFRRLNLMLARTPIDDPVYKRIKERAGEIQKILTMNDIDHDALRMQMEKINALMKLPMDENLAERLKRIFSETFTEVWEKDYAGKGIDETKSFVLEKLEEAGKLILDMTSETAKIAKQYFMDYWEVLKEQFQKDIDKFISFLKSKLPDFADKIEEFREKMDELLSLPEMDIANMPIPEVKTKTEVKMGFADAKSMWKQMASSMLKKEENEIQNKILAVSQQQVHLQADALQATKKGFDKVEKAVERNNGSNGALAD